MRDVHAMQNEIRLSTCAPFHIEPHSRFSKKAFIADNGRVFTMRAISRFAIIHSTALSGWLKEYGARRVLARRGGRVRKMCKARLGAPGWAGEKHAERAV
jgi:hypothetical protein